MAGITTEKVIRELKRIKKKAPYRIDRMFLFGSRARGDELLTSDADVMVISPDFESVKFRARPDFFLDEWKLPIDFEVLCYYPAEFERKKKEIGIVREADSQAVEI
jgi:predicted nucleotidyltransferase